jgi:hypothetical protein
MVGYIIVYAGRHARVGAARGASGVADQGYCSTTRSYYDGVQLHAVALRRAKRLPLPALLHLSRASQHDPSALRELSPDPGAGYLFGAKAYAGEGTRRVLAGRGTHLLTPHKRGRNEPETATPALWSRFVSSVRRPLESLFGWLIQRTGIQNASQVRSAQGLFVHCDGKLAVACLLLTFNS